MPKFISDKKRKEIIEIKEKNENISLKKIAIKANVSKSFVYKVIKNYEKN